MSDRTNTAEQGLRHLTRLATLLSLAAVLVAILTASPARAAVGPYFIVKALWGDTNLTPGGPGQFVVQARNVGDGEPSAPLTIADKLPGGVKEITGITWHDWLKEGQQPDGTNGPNLAETYCSGIGTRTLSCTIPTARAIAMGGQAPGILEPEGTGGSSKAAWPTGYIPAIYVDVLVDENASGTATNTATVSGGGASAPFTDTDQVPFNSMSSSFGVVPGSFEADFFDAAYPFGSLVRQAGAHPFEYRANVDLNERTSYHNCSAAPCGGAGTPGRYITPVGSLRSTEVTLPRGMIGNPEALPKCDPVDFASPGATGNATGCPADTQVGYLNARTVEPDQYAGANGEGVLGEFLRGALVSHVAIYNLKPPKGRLADFAFNAGGLVQGHIYPSLDPERNYAITTITPNTSNLVLVRGFDVTFWGVPGDPAHNLFRYYPSVQTVGGEKVVAGASWGSAPIRPFFTMPMDCGVENGGSLISVDSYEHPGKFTDPVEGAPLNVTGCEDSRFRFQPDITLEPTDRHAGAPTGLEVKLQVPQRNDEATNPEELYAQNGSVQGIATPPIKKTVVTLPEGMTLNPSAGQGLSGCSLEQLGMTAAGVPNAEPVRCPTSAQIGTLVMHSPDLPITEPLEGRVYIARQGENPFGSLFALYLVLENKERGLLVKLAGRIDLDPLTGKITTTFDDLPQFPVSDFQLKFKSGPRAALVNPSTCGRKAIIAEYFSWQDPNTPHTATDFYEVTQNPDGSPCVNSPAEWPFGPLLSAGTVNPIAGAFSPFTLRLTRGDTEQQLSGLSLTLPPGLSGKLAGVEECPDANIAAAMTLDHAGQGVIEQAHPSCPAGSLIGESLVSAGTGPALSYVPGKVYFAGPYKGAPFSVVVITPSVVGPYDLGTVTVRNALYIDPTTAQVHVVSDPLPKILDGIFVRIRDLRIDLNRPQFTFNPTSCAEQQITGSASAFEGASATFSQRFQVASCQGLGFKPKFTASTSGRPSRKNGASLDVKVTYPKFVPGSLANIAKVKVSLPKQLPSRLETLQKACLDSVFNANPANCPVASRVGVAKVITPILPVPLTGPSYFVSHGAREFPDLVTVLQGYGITVYLRGQTYISKKGITSSTYRAVPDVPFESFELRLPQGPFSALTNNGNPCKVKGGLKMPTMLTAQNGMVVKQETKIAVSGCPKKAKKHRPSKAKKG